MSDYYDADYREEAAVLGWDENKELPKGFFDDLPTPLYFRLLVMPVAPKKVSSGGIVIPVSAQEAQKYLNYTGKLLAIGSTAFTDETTKYEENKPNIGDYVVYGRYAGQVLLYKDVRLLIVNDRDVLAIVKNPDSLKVSI